jgi:hypothetical protein
VLDTIHELSLVCSHIQILLEFDSAGNRDLAKFLQLIFSSESLSDVGMMPMTLLAI